MRRASSCLTKTPQGCGRPVWSSHQLVNFFSLLDMQSPVEQVIDVPKITQDSIQQRLVDGDLRRTQMAVQLVEVPTTLSLSLLQQQRAEQIVDNPVPCGGLQGFRQGHGSFASSAISRPADGWFRTFPGVKKKVGVRQPVPSSPGRLFFSCQGRRGVQLVDAGGL